MLILLTTLLAALCAIFRSRAALELENLALRHQIGVLQRSTTKRPKLTAGDLSFAKIVTARNLTRRTASPLHRWRLRASTHHKIIQVGPRGPSCMNSVS